MINIPAIADTSCNINRAGRIRVECQNLPFISTITVSLQQLMNQIYYMTLRNPFIPPDVKLKIILDRFLAFTAHIV